MPHTWLLTKCTSTNGLIVCVNRLWLIGMMFFIRMAQAQSPLVLTDIHSGDYPHFLVSMENTLYFVTQPESFKSVLWQSDGTAGGAKPVDPNNNGNILALGVCNSMLYFDRDDNVHGIEIWTSNGTASGTSMLKDIHPIGGQGLYCEPVYMNGTVYFIANDYTHGSELWRTDGTRAGTYMVKDIHPTNNGLQYQKMTVFNNFLYFMADDGTHGQELWSSDGTEAGTSMVIDLNPGSSSSAPVGLTVYHGALYFYATTAALGDELYTTDGTEAGTVLVKDINPGVEGSGQSQFFVAFKDELYFSVRNIDKTLSLWKTDGTNGGTVPVHAITDNPYTDLLDEHMYAECKGKLYFMLVNSANINELWMTDGTTAGTTLVKNVNTSSKSWFDWLVAYKDNVYFQADDGVHGVELWQSDGTAAGTFMTADLNPGSDYSSPSYFCLNNGALYFTAITAAHSVNIWKLAPPEYVRPAIQATRVCKGEKTVLKTTLKPPVTAYHWEIKEGDNPIIRHDDADSITHIFAQSGTFTVQLLVEVNGTTDTIAREVIVDSLPQDYIKDTYVCAGSTPAMQAQPNQLSYLWNTGNTASQQTIEAGNTYYVDVANSCGSTRDEATVYEITYTVTNLVTQNQDGMNDHLVVESNTPVEGRLEIYNAWGVKLYANSAYNNSWPEQEMEAGVYFYQFSYDTCNPDKGWMQVLK